MSFLSLFKHHTAWMPNRAAFLTKLDKEAGNVQVVAAAYTAKAGDKVYVNTTDAALTITLPASPEVGDTVEIADAQSTFATNNVTVARNGKKIDGSAANATLSTNGKHVRYTYVGGAKEWRVTAYN